jgi:hypothetical protein
MNIHQIFDEKMQTASKGDRTRIHSILVFLKQDCKILKENKSNRLYKIFKNFYSSKIKEEISNYNDPTLSTYIINKCISNLRAVYLNKEKNESN